MESKSKNSVDIFNKRAAGYALKFASVKQYHDGFNFLCEQLASGSSVLDLACGPGNISNYLLSIRPDLKLLGVDLAPKMIEIAASANKNANFKLGDIRKIKALNQKFNTIVLGFGLPYLSKEEVKQVIADAHKCIIGNGLIYLSTMEGKYSDSTLHKSSDGQDEMFIYYHEYEYIQQFLKMAGFEIIWEKQQPYKEGGKLKFEDYIVIAQKK